VLRAVLSRLTREEAVACVASFKLEYVNDWKNWIRRAGLAGNSLAMVRRFRRAVSAKVSWDLLDSWVLWTVSNDVNAA
jgi:hypothetical protein